MQCHLVTTNSPVWSEYLSNARHDFYHLPQFAALSAMDEGEQPWAFIAESGRDRFFVPLIVRPLNLPQSSVASAFDAVSPYGYPTPLIFSLDGGKPGDDFIVQALQSLASVLRERGVISVFLRLHPLLPVPLAPFGKSGRLLQNGQTIYVDLKLPHEVLWQQTSASTRNLISAANRLHYSVDMGRSLENIGAFADLYLETMRRVGAADLYHFSDRYLAQLFQGMKEYFHLFLVRIEGRVAGGGIFSECCGIVQYHLSGTRDEYRKLPVTRFLLNFARAWAKERGNEMLHLGGGVGAAEDSLFEFKAKFSPLRRPFYTWRLILDSAAYSAAVAQWECLAARQADPPEGFFPAYRKAID